MIEGGRKLRLIGIDAPELGRDTLPDDPYALAAQAELARVLRAGGDRIRLLPGVESRDRYGRLLAHVYASDGANLSEHLLRRGLSYQTAIPPNDRFIDCYRAAEDEARAAGAGLWAAPALEAARLPADLEGFQRIAGRVLRVRAGRGATSLELELDGRLVLRIRDQDLPRFDARMLDALPGSRVEVRGWIYRYRGQPRIRLRDPSALRIE